VTDGPASDLSRVSRLIREVVAPTTLATGLLFYFGWSHAYWFFDYFGVNSTVLGLTPSDHLMRGLDGLFVPLVVVAIVALVVVWARSLLAGQLAGRRVPPWLPPALGVAGVALCANGLSRVFVKTALNRGLAVAPVCLAAGVAAIAVAVRLATAGQPRSETAGMVEYGAVFVLVALSLFWAANDYSAAVGRARAAQFVRQLPTHPEAIVYSREDLHLAGDVGAVRCADTEDDGYRWRYDGLALVLQSSDQYVLVPEGWTKADGVAIVLPRTDDVRLEFRRPGGPALPPRC
jgi:hypothetical protein